MDIKISLLEDFISLIYPRICMSCGKSLFKHEECICTMCLYHLPKTNFHLEEDNPVSRKFWGKANINSAASFYFFYKGGRVQKLIHELKYKNRKEIGVFLGNLYGKELSKAPLFNTADLIIPVPLHPKKQRKRGYNQSEMFANGLSQSMNIPVDVKTLIKTTETDSQTKKSSFNRWENVKEVFELKNYNHLSGKHILLVDDVITTSSTLESCVINLAKVQGIKISIATMAFAHY